MTTLVTLPHEIIASIGQILLGKPGRKHGSDVCCWIRTATRYAAILVPLLYKNAFLPTKPQVVDRYGSVDAGFLVSTPPYRMWPCAANWQSDIMLGYLSSMSLEWITTVRFYIERNGYITEMMFNKIVRSGNMNLVQFFLARGVDPNDEAPLLTAIAEGHLDLVKLLVDAGAAISFRGNKGELENEPLCLAIVLHSHNENQEIALFLIESIISRGGSIEHPGIDGHTPLYHAVQESSIDLVRLLLGHGADVFTVLNPSLRGHTPCHNSHVVGSSIEAEVSILLFDKMEENDHDRLLGLVDDKGNTVSLSVCNTETIYEPFLSYSWDADRSSCCVSFGCPT